MGMHTRSFVALTAAALLSLSACGSSTTAHKTADSTGIETSSTPAKDTKPSDTASLLAALDTAAADGFTCRIGNTIVVQDSTPEGWNSFYASYIDSAARGLEIVTLDGVSYARWIGEPLSDASPSQVKLIKQLAGAWGTANQPDTILLEEIPSSASVCLDWAGVQRDAISAVRVQDNGSWSFQTSLLEPDDALVTGTGSTTSQNGLMTGLNIISNGDSVLEITFELPVEFPEVTSRNRPQGLVEALSQNEYFALVGS